MPLALSAAANAAQPVACVMSIPELFTAVMHFALDVYPPSMEDGYPPRDSLFKDVRALGAAVVASHVCVAWRILSIGTPTLWARQIGWIRPAVAEFLNRSGQAQLDIYWGPKNCDATLWPVAYPIKSSRLESLVWSGRSNFGNIQRALSGRLCNLVTLNLHGRWDFLQPALGIDTTIDLPQLVHMNLEGIQGGLHVAFNSPKLKVLLVRCADVTVACLLSTLRSSPLLEELTLDDCQYIMTAGTESSDLIELPNLQLLDLSDFGGLEVNLAPRVFHDILNLLSTVPFQLLVLLEVESDWMQSLLSIGLHHALARNVSNCLVYSTELKFYAHVNPCTATLSPTIHDPTYRAQLSFGDSTWLISTLPRLRMRERFSEITILVLHPCTAKYTNYSEAAVRLLMCALPHVETYWVTASTPQPAWGPSRDKECHCLWRGLIPDTTVDHENQLPFPRLRTLGIDVTVDTHPLPRLLGDACEILKLRRENGMENIDTLSFPSIVRPSFDDEGAAHLPLPFVRAVYWSQESTPGDQ